MRKVFKALRHALFRGPQVGEGPKQRRWQLPVLPAHPSPCSCWRMQTFHTFTLNLCPPPSSWQALGTEVAALRRHCQEVPGEAHFFAPGRRGGALARVAVRLLRGFL